MKKYFLFAAVAGMLASCSSESLTGSDPKIEPTQDDRVPIEITVASPEVKGATRSVGTVGDVTGGNNYWQKEKVNVFMFEQGTMNLALEGGNAIYDDVALTTPASLAQGGTANTDTGIAYEYYDSNTDGTDDRVRYKYYPSNGNYDFWGYYKDDANAVDDPATPVDESAISYGTSEVKVPFTITGAQDLMVAKAEPTAAEIASLGARSSDYYSAYAARKTVQPDMKFRHLLTRLTFSIVGGNDDACGFVTPATLPADGNVYTGVFVKSIKVKSKFKGDIIAAYTSSSSYVPTSGTVDKLISFDTSAGPNGDGYDMLSLQSERSATTGQVSPLYDETNTFTNWTSNATMEPLLTIDETTGTINTHWDEIMRPTSTTAPTKVGGALLVSTESASYYIEVEIGQYLLESENIGGGSPAYKIVYSTFKKDITPTDAAFLQGYSYNVKMTLYGYERIEIHTTLEEWKSGSDVDITAD